MSIPNTTLLSLIEDTAEQHLTTPDQHLTHALANSTQHNLPSISITPLQGQHLSLLAQLTHAQSVLEIGTLGGYSTIWFAKTGARVTSIEIDPKHRAVALENLHHAGLDANIVLGAALDVLPRLYEAGDRFDFVFVDADWGEQWEYFDWAAKLTRKGGAIYVDNVVQMMMGDGEDGVKSEGSLVVRAGKDERVRATLVPTISAHKNPGNAFIDGFLLAIVL